MPIAQTLDLPGSVRDRACFQQYIGGLAVHPTFFDQAVRTIESMGMPKVWEINEQQPPSVFSRSIWALAASMRIAGIEAEFPDSFKAQQAKEAQPDAKLDGQEMADEWGSPPYVISNGTAIIPVNGPLSKQPSSLEGIFGGSSTIGMRKALDLALADRKVKRIMFHIDSPGGTVAGTGDLGDDIYVASAEKPIAAFVEDMGTSAAYWVASQTARIYASQYAEVGSIGVIWTVYDTSGAYEKAGIKVRAITSTPGKAFVVDGMPITKEQVAKMQAFVDSIYGAFLGVVARGRAVSLTDVRKMAGDADVYNAPLALDIGLIDAIMPFRDALADFARDDAGAKRKEARILPLVREKLARSPEATAPIGAGERASNSPLRMLPHEESPVTPDPKPEGQTAEGAPPVTSGAAPMRPLITLPKDEFDSLKQGAADGREALRMAREREAKDKLRDDAHLAREKDRVLADNPSITKEDIAEVTSLAELHRAEAIAKRSTGAKRTGADPNGSRDPAPAKVLEEQVNTKEDIDAWQKGLDARHAASTQAVTA